jgi:hypothetical protein
MATPGTWQTFSLGGMQYQLLLPDGYSTNQQYPVLLFLQGGGEENLLPQMIDPWFNTPAFRSDFPAIVVAPQLVGSSANVTWGGYPVDGDANSTGENGALAIVQQVVTQYSTDPARVYVTGLSLGGHGTWDLMIKYNAYNGPDGRIFAAGLSLSGAEQGEGAYELPSAAIVSQLQDVPIWAIHGSDGAQAWDEAMAKDELPGSAYHYTENLSLGHDVWDTYYPLPNGLPFFNWMFSQSARGPGGLSDIAVDDTTTGALMPATASIYNGPVQSLWNEYIAITNDSLNVAVGSGGWFIHTGGGTDAISAYSGTNVLDGGTGSNFLTGGSGTDTFFVDDRGAAADIWSTIANFHTGDAATIWGITQADFNIAWQDGQGAAGYTGLTMHATAPGKATASVSLAGYSQADLSNGRLSVSFGTDAASGSTYMYIHAN